MHNLVESTIQYQCLKVVHHGVVVVLSFTTICEHVECSHCIGDTGTKRKTTSFIPRLDCVSGHEYILLLTVFAELTPNTTTIPPSSKIHHLVVNEEKAYFV